MSHSAAFPIVLFSEADITRTIEELGVLLKDAVDGGASVNYIAPMRIEDAVRYWQRVAQEVGRGDRIVMVARDGSGHIAGCVHLVPAGQPNGKHRAEVQKMLVHSRYRKMGLGRALLSAAERHALRLGRTLLTLDTERYSAGEALYRSCGWVQAGIIPDFASNFDGTKLVDAAVYYKRVGEMPRL